MDFISVDQITGEVLSSAILAHLSHGIFRSPTVWDRV